MKGDIRWAATGVFGALLLLQIIRWGALGFAIQAPLLLILALGLILAAFRDSLPFRNHALFICAYAAGFLLIWAVGRPEFQGIAGRTWLATLTAVLALGGGLAWNLREHKDFKWLITFVCASGFGLLVAFISGPQGGPKWMLNFYMDLLRLKPDEWEIAHRLVTITRKSMHFTGYGLAALCTAITAQRVKPNLIRSLAFGIAWPLPIAIFDEFEQARSANRTGQLTDVLLDLSGMITFLFFFWLRERNRHPDL